MKLKKLFLGCLLLASTMSRAMVTEIDSKKWYRIKPLNKNDMCYDVKCGSDEDCTKIILWKTCGDSKNQQFQFRKAPNSNAYFITPRHTSLKCLDIEEGSQRNRARCILYHNIFFRGHGRHKNQEFYVTRAGGDLWRIINVQSGMALGFDEDDNVCQMLLEYGTDTVVQLEEVDEPRQGKAQASEWDKFNAGLGFGGIGSW